MGFQCFAFRRVPHGAVLGLAMLGMGCASAGADDASAPASLASPAIEARPTGAPQVGVASFYARHFTGRRMANGRPFDPASDTIAHRTLPFGTVVRVTNLHNGRTATARVHDRGPWIQGRIVDVSPRIARELDMIRSGLARVEVVPVELAEARD
jgi:rare lipoprotein A